MSLRHDASSSQTLIHNKIYDFLLLSLRFFAYTLVCHAPTLYAHPGMPMPVSLTRALTVSSWLSLTVLCLLFSTLKAKTVTRKPEPKTRKQKQRCTLSTFNVLCISK